jgi:hypothetical protein
MRLVLNMMVRLIVATTIPLTVLAVSLGRDNLRRLGERRMAAPRYQPLNDYLFPRTDPHLRVLDLETGTLEPVRLADGGRLLNAACSPWRDSQGRTHVIGTWKPAAGARPQVLGLARYAIPTGEVLDQVELVQWVPSDPPCWFPDMSLRALFGSHDGCLYRVSFEAPGWGRGTPDEVGTAPKRVTWPRGLPAPGLPKLSEPTWPTDPRLGGRLIATLTFQELDLAAREQPRSQLWWLRLKSDGSAIVEGGRLIRPCPAPRGSEPVREERLARVSVTVDGRLTLAYLVRRGARSESDLQLAPLVIDAATGNPRVDEADTVTLARNRSFAPPAFSPDGRWVYSLTRWPPGTASPERSALAGVFDKRSRRYDVTMCPADLGHQQ